MSDPLRIRQEAPDGKLIARDGLVFVLFVPGRHAQIGAAVADLAQAYVAMIGPDRMTLIHDRGEQFRKLTPKKLAGAIARCREQRSSSSDFEFTLRDGTDELAVAEHYFNYAGGTDEAEDGEASAIEIWFPTEYLDQLGIVPFVKGVLALAERVPFASGYVSLALNYHRFLRNFVRGIALRHPGIDVHDSSMTGMAIGDGVRGAYWLTLLGPQPLAKLGMDAAALRAALGDEITVHQMANGVAIQAGERPLAGDVNRNERLPLVRKVAQVIEPVQVVQEKGRIFTDDRDEWVNWQRRHLL